MPFLISGMLYAIVAVPALAALGLVCIARRRAPGPVAIGGVAGSLVGFALGCLAAIVIGIAVPGVGSRIGATTLIAPISLAGALVGSAVGATIPYLARQTD